MESDDLKNRFAFHPASPDKAERHETVRDACLIAAQRVDLQAPESREKSLAITHLEDAMMWANAAIARHDDKGDRIGS